MRVAVISDIHGNMMAFNRVLDDARKEGISEYIFLGDYITDSGDSKEVLNKVKEVATYAIMGNREAYMLNYDPKKRNFVNYKPIVYTYESLDNDDLNYIKSLPKYQVIGIGGYKILLVHGDEYSRDGERNIAAFDEWIRKFDFDVCLFGHIHKFASFMYKGKRFINPGSVGLQSDDASFKYVILDISSDIKVIKRTFLGSDIFDEWQEKYRLSQFYRENREWGDMVIASFRDANPYGSWLAREFKHNIASSKRLDYREYNERWKKIYQRLKDKYF